MLAGTIVNMTISSMILLLLFAGCNGHSKDKLAKPIISAQVEKVFVRDTILGQKISVLIRFGNSGTTSDTLTFRKKKNLLNESDNQRFINSRVYVTDSSGSMLGEFELWGIEPDDVVLIPNSSIKLLFLLENESIRFPKASLKEDNLQIVRRFLTDHKILFSSLDKTNQGFFGAASIPLNIEYYYRPAFIDDL